MDWSLPTLGSQYSDAMDLLKGRDIDAVTLVKDPASNLPTGAIKFDRATLKFQEWSGAAWTDRILSVAGGGTGAATASGARSSLGLGTISTQNANSVAIAGGTISGITALSLNGPLTVSTDDTVVVGTNGNRISRAYLRSALVIPVGTDKYATS